jgi:hypothetical protein
VNEALEKPGRDIAGISPGRKKEIAGQILYIPFGNAEGSKADNKIPACVTVRNGKNVDPIQEIRPGRETLDACDEGLPEVLHHRQNPFSFRERIRLTLRRIILDLEEI